MPEPLSSLRASAPKALHPLSIQASVEHVEIAARLHLEYGFDVVLTASSDPRRDPYLALEKAARAFTDMTGAYAQLDANRYAGPNRRHGATPLNAEWARKQIDLGAPLVVTDAGYLGEDTAQLQLALAKAAELQRSVDAQVLAIIPVDASMMRKKRAEIVDLIGASDVPVGLALGHAKDPLSAQSVVGTLIELLARGNVQPRRIDLSGIGALAFGAEGVSIGTTATLRHVYPTRNSGGGTSPYWSTLVPKTMSWRTHDRVMDAASTFTDHVFWQCECSYCYGRPVSFAVRTEEAAISHNFATVSMIADRVLTSSDPRASWLAMCQHAQTYAFSVMAASGPGWEPQDFLGAWIANRPIPVES